MAMGSNNDGTLFWMNSLSLPETLTDLGVVGLWFDSKAIGSVVPNPSIGPPAPLSLGIQGPGNGMATLSPALTPQQMAESTTSAERPERADRGDRRDRAGAGDYSPTPGQTLRSSSAAIASPSGSIRTSP